MSGQKNVWLGSILGSILSELIVRVCKKIDMCVKLEWVAGSRRAGEGLVWMDW